MAAPESWGFPGGFGTADSSAREGILDPGVPGFSLLLF